MDIEIIQTRRHEDYHFPTRVTKLPASLLYPYLERYFSLQLCRFVLFLKLLCVSYSHFKFKILENYYVEKSNRKKSKPCV